MSQPVIALRDIRVTYTDRPVLPGVSLCVNRGDFMTITGPNGGGKTTLLRVMLKLLTPDSGTVTYYDTAGRPTNRLAIGYLPQKSMIDTHFPITVGEVVRSGMIRNLWGRYPADAARRYDEVTQLMGIAELADRPIGALSGGQLQRTLLGRALITDPTVLVLDEPLSYVDKRFEHQIYSIMADLAKRITIVLVSHELSVISGMANRHIIVDDGVHECHSPHHQRRDDCDEDYSV
ncbi:MAG: metal ABC transporter ATP-binding protein [Muribaculaceae bacterium]|nr:metal ABC transporter ATP-binding protein [Muribaculaceae bacterium]